jgi:hypothetical protein
MRHKKQTDQKRNTAAGSYKQGLKSASPGLIVLVFIGHQKERNDAGSFPEDEQRYHITGHNQPQHGTHEEQKVGKKPPGSRIISKVLSCVDNHNSADERDQQGKKRSEAVEI